MAALFTREGRAEETDAADRRSYLSLLTHIPAARTALELGSAYGRSFPLLREKFRCVVGIELVADAVRHCLHQGWPAVWGVIERLPWPDGCFDAVISRHVMEHTRDPVQTLREIRRVLVPGGYVGAITPHFFPDPEPAHLTKLSAEEWLKEYQREGFEVVRLALEQHICPECHIVARKPTSSSAIPAPAKPYAAGHHSLVPPTAGGIVSPVEQE